MVGVLKPSKMACRWNIAMSSAGIGPNGSTRFALPVDASDVPDSNESAWYDGSFPLYDVPIEDSSSMNNSWDGRCVKPSLSGSASCPLGCEAAELDECS